MSEEPILAEGVEEPILAEAVDEAKKSGGRKRRFPLWLIGVILMIAGVLRMDLAHLLGEVPENPTTASERGAAAAPFLDFVVCELAGIAIIAFDFFKCRRTK